MANKPTPPRGARLLAVSGQEDNFILYGNLTKTIIDDNWHNFQDFERVISTGNLVTATDGSKWLIGSGYRGEERLYDGYILYGDRDAIWYDLPTVQIPPPDKPAQVRASSVAGGKVGLMWNAISGANVEIERGASTAGPFSKVGVAKSGESSYTEANLSVGPTYYYRLRSSNDNGDSAYTDVVSATAGAEVAPTPMPTPTPSIPTPARVETPVPTSTVTPQYIPLPSVSTPQSTTENPTKSWMENNIVIVLAGGGLLFVVLMVVIANRR